MYVHALWIQKKEERERKEVEISHKENEQTSPTTQGVLATV
jgi:hypothetical protein